MKITILEGARKIDLLDALARAKKWYEAQKASIVVLEERTDAN